MPQRSMFKGLAARWAERSKFGSFSSWLIYLYDRVLPRFPSLPLPGRGKTVGVYVQGISQPIWARLGTTDMHVLGEVFVDGEYDTVVADGNKGQASSAVVANGTGRLIVDLGSNIGLSLRLWRERWPGCSVLGVEPDAANFEICRRNVDSTTGPAPSLHKACVAGRARVVDLDRSRGAWAIQMKDTTNSAGSPGPGSGEVEAVTLDELLALSGIPADAPIDLLKCDIEGAEAEVFAAGGAWLSRCKRLVVEVHTPYNQAKLEADIAAHGLKFETRVLKSNGSVAVLWLTR